MHWIIHNIFHVVNWKTDMACKNHSRDGAQNYERKEEEASKAKELQKKKQSFLSFDFR